MIAERSLLWSLMTGVILLAPHATAQDVRQSKGPIIIKPTGKEIILKSGQNYTLECVGKRPIQFKQQDVPEENTGNFFFEERWDSENESEYRAMLDLYNVDQFAVGYYACFDDTVNSHDVLTEMIEEPTNTENISYIYVYVNGSSLFAPMRTFVIANKNKFVIECKPTTPDITVRLLDIAEYEYQYNHKLGFVVNNDVLQERLNLVKCSFEKQGLKDEREVFVQKNFITEIPKPQIGGFLQPFLEGESFTINCTVPMQTNVPLRIDWKIPGLWDKVFTETNANNVHNNQLYSNITVVNATSEDAGDYICEARTNANVRNENRFKKIFYEKPVLNPYKQIGKNDPIEVTTKMYNMRINMNKTYPPASVTVLKDGRLLPETDKFKRITNPDYYILKVTNTEPADSGNYTFKVSNGYLTTDLKYEIYVKGYPRIDFGAGSDKRYLKGVMMSLQCEATGYPTPSISWIFANGNESTNIDQKFQKDYFIQSVYKVGSILNLQALRSGNITCRAKNSQGEDEVTRKLLIDDIPGGFGIKDSHKTWFSEGDEVVLKCYASRYDYFNVSWFDHDDVEIADVKTVRNEDSLISYLTIKNINVAQAGPYTCKANKINGTKSIQAVSLTVARKQDAEMLEPEDKTLAVSTFQPVHMSCAANAVPPPEIVWYKDEDELLHSNDTQIQTLKLNQTLVNSTITIRSMKKELFGTYQCKVSSQGYTQVKTYKLVQNETHIAPYLGVAGILFLILILVVLYLIWKIRKEKQFRKELAAAGLLYFKEGVTKSLNPALGIDEQAELLPYDDKFEFPAEKLTLGKQLGAGAFGVVYKAEARGIINAEENTTVAVKMVKKTADNMYIKALASELKIMVHLGKHINIVNLLGACTKNVGKRELIVIVEYCKFGNIHNYLMKHREVFIDQLNDNPEKAMGKVNRGFSSSSANSGLHSDYFGSNHTQNTDNTFLNTANTNRSGRKVSETGYIQPEWRSNYESDYSDGRMLRPLCSRDLLAWAFQIARGMEYLASRKVLHGDLAARNILLAEDNIVKICDFGLARSIYKNDEYQKKENSPLPVKWLAIECMTDRIFSTQSDVWSFGIVLWELFSLAKTPYPNISPSSLLHWLSEGHRLDKPAYSDDRIYEVMKQCWASKPTARPSFSQLQEIIGSFLEDNVRNHYVDLNAAYMDMNVKSAGEEDYLAMVCAPEYNNIVTPSPHHYVNERSFFPPTPTQLQHDDEGYLQMSPATRQSLFNARAQGTKFDFDARKLTPRVSDTNSYGESTPMLTLNNLPRSGSESDQEMENTSPYLNMCPRIEEEADDVFGTKENNAKNIQPDGVTNLTYITLSVDDEKKPHNYMNVNNVNAANGLVK